MQLDPFTLNFIEFEEKVIVELSSTIPLTDAQLQSVRDTADSLNVKPTKALTRLALCSEEVIISKKAEMLGWTICNTNASCPPYADVMSAIASNEVSLVWCLQQQVFIRYNAKKLQIYVADESNTFALSVVTSSNQEWDTEFVLLSSSMAESIGDELKREQEVMQLFGSNTTNAAALAQEAPVINLVNSLLEKAIVSDASDIHIEAEENNMVVRFRVDGVLQEFMRQPISRFAAIASRIKLLSELDIAERRLPQDGRFSTRQLGLEFDIRVSTAPSVHGESIVMRLLPKKREELSLANLGFEQDHLDMIQHWGKLPNGIVLVTGPTGSGKSTTLYALLNQVKTGTEKIVTVEDPVEFQLEGITQVQAKTEIGYTFASALRTFLRQDPDVIMVGEIRDKETADISVQSSLTGHLVLSTLHTNDACSVFARLWDIGVEPFMIAATIQGVQAQRLVKKLCQHCAQPSSAPTFLDMSFEHANWKTAKGCEKCNGKGYQGRIGIYELIQVDSSLREKITKQADLSELQASAKASGFRTLLDDGLIKASKGITSVDEVIRVCSMGNQD